MKFVTSSVPACSTLLGSMASASTMSVSALGFMASSLSRLVIISVSMFSTGMPVTRCLTLPAMAVFLGIDFRGGTPPFFLRSQLVAVFSFSFLDFIR